MDSIKIFSKNYINQKLFEKNKNNFFQMPSIYCINYNQTNKNSYLFKEIEKDYFLKTNRPFDEILYEKTFHNLFQLEKYSKLNQKQIIKKIYQDILFVFQKIKQIIKKIYQDILFVFQKIKPIIKIGADIEIDIVGGCVRNFIYDLRKTSSFRSEI